MNVHIRRADSKESEGIRDICLRAFPEEENQLIGRLAERLLNEVSIPETLTLVALIDEQVIAHVSFSPVHESGGAGCIAYILAPLAVMPGFQCKGIGKKLVNSGIQQLSETGINLFLVYGDPEYYGRFGFNAEAAADLVPPYRLTYPFGWLATPPVSGARVSSKRLSVVAPLQNPQLW